MMEYITTLSLTQVGLYLDILGFMLIFLFGGLSLGSPGTVTVGGGWKATGLIRGVGFVLVVVGFALQIAGAA